MFLTSLIKKNHTIENHKYSYKSNKKKEKKKKKRDGPYAS